MGKQQKGVNGLLFYDFEVFKYDWLVVVMDMTAKKTHVIINSPEELEALYKKFGLVLTAATTISTF